MPQKTTPPGVLIIDKPAGITSHDVVDHVRKTIQVGLPTEALAKVGHAGTLDPFATGVLIVAIGNATRLLEYTHDLEKTYVAEITLGATSDTDDVTGKITPYIPHPPRHESASPSQGEAPLLTKERSALKPGEVKIQQALNSFLGPIQQIPPSYSAIKVQGKKLYEYARGGLPAEALAKAGERVRTVQIYAIKIISYAYPTLTLEILCGSGTYIRALARDIGEALSTGAYVSQLRRTAIGNFREITAVKLAELSTVTLSTHLQPPEVLVKHLPSVSLSSENVAKFQRGQSIHLIRKAGEVSFPIAVFNKNKTLLGIGNFDPSTSLLHPKKVL